MSNRIYFGFMDPAIALQQYLQVKRLFIDVVSRCGYLSYGGATTSETLNQLQTRRQAALGSW
jgi:hypothetical protein